MYSSKAGKSSIPALLFSYFPNTFFLPDNGEYNQNETEICCLRNPDADHVEYNSFYLLDTIFCWWALFIEVLIEKTGRGCRIIASM